MWIMTVNTLIFYIVLIQVDHGDDLAVSRGIVTVAEPAMLPLVRDDQPGRIGVVVMGQSRAMAGLAYKTGMHVRPEFEHIIIMALVAGFDARIVHRFCPVVLD